MKALQLALQLFVNLNRNAELVDIYVNILHFLRLMFSSKC